MGRISQRRISFLVIAMVAIGGCSSRSLVADPGVLAGYVPSAPSPGPNSSWTLPPERAERLLAHGPLAICAQTGAGGGVTGASKLTVSVAGEEAEIVVKWKPVPAGLDGWNNSPRKELAAYEIQKLFLDPDDYVVPPTVIRCLPLNEYERALGHAAPNVRDASCVLGVISLWLRDVKSEKDLFSRKRFANDPNYAYHVANFNLLTFLIAHKDGRSSNFLVSANDSDRRVFSIDNGISFDPWIYNYFVRNWHELRVSALSRRAVERLRSVRASDVRSLETLVELHTGSDGLLRVVAPTTNLEDTSGVRTANGRIQLGLEANEIADLHARIHAVLRAVDDGRIAVF